MTIREDITTLIKSDELNNEVKEIIGIFLEMIFEEAPIPIKLISGTLNVVTTLREKLLLSKFRMFIEGVFINPTDRIKISELFDCEQDQLEYVQILIKTLDDVETQEKVTYLINLTRALLIGIIEDKNDYYRMFNCVRTVLEQDLKYLSSNIESDMLLNNVHVDFLFQAGLMYKSYDSGTIGADVDHYSFTALAKMLNECALNFNEDLGISPTCIRSLENTSHQGITAGLSYRYTDGELHFNENKL